GAVQSGGQQCAGRAQVRQGHVRSVAVLSEDHHPGDLCRRRGEGNHVQRPWAGPAQPGGAPPGGAVHVSDQLLPRQSSKVGPLEGVLQAVGGGPADHERPPVRAQPRHRTVVHDLRLVAPVLARRESTAEAWVALVGGHQDPRSISATRNAISSDCWWFSRGSTLVSYRRVRASWSISSLPPSTSVTSEPVSSTCSPPGTVPAARCTSKKPRTSSMTSANRRVL